MNLVLSFLFAFSALASVTAVATEAAVTDGVLPAALICTAPAAKVKAVRRIKVVQLQNEEPTSSFRMGFQDMSVEKGIVNISFSDECEGWYALTFNESDLKSLKAGSSQRLSGTLEYDDLGEFFPGHPVGDDENGHDKTPVTCKRSKSTKIESQFD